MAISEKRMQTAIKKYNELMYYLGLGFNTIGTDDSEETEDWGLREMVEECEYQLHMYYEEGTNQYDALHDMDDENMTLETLMDKEQFTKYMIRKDWVEDEKKKMKALRKFINQYKKFA